VDPASAAKGCRRIPYYDRPVEAVPRLLRPDAAHSSPDQFVQELCTELLRAYSAQRDVSTTAHVLEDTDSNSRVLHMSLVPGTTIGSFLAGARASGCCISLALASCQAHVLLIFIVALGQHALGAWP
jgi:hypothetical protein